MSGEQNNQLIRIEQATTFEEALKSALGVLNSMLSWKENHRLDSILWEVKYTDGEFEKKVTNQDTLTSFYNAVLLLHSNLILFSDFNNKDYTFTQEASCIHLKVVGQIKSLETQGLKQGDHPKNKYKYLKIWKELLKEIIWLCSDHSKSQKRLPKNVAQNKKLFPILGSMFSSLSTAMRKRRSLPKVSWNWSGNSAIKDDTSNNSTAPAPENETSPASFKISGQNLHVVITIMIVVLGIVLALTVFR